MTPNKARGHKKIVHCTKKIKKWDDSTGNLVRQEFPCGQCTSCRITRRQEWTLRILLELLSNSQNYFITLTYSDEKLESLSLQKKHLQKFFKRLRKRLNRPIRYFATGEYGGRGGRPHFHILLFTDIEPTELGQLGYKINKKRQLVPVISEGKIHDSWKKGWVEAQILETNRQASKAARYVAGYCLKKLTSDARIAQKYPGRTPEFMLSSRRPGIGLGAAGAIASRIRDAGISAKGTAVESPNGSASLYMLRIDGKKWPVDRVLRERIIQELGDNRTAVGKAVVNSQKLITRILLCEPEKEEQAEAAREFAAFRIDKIARESRSL